MTPSRLDYIPGSTITPPGAFTISPSSLGKFFDEPHTWYREYVLGQREFDSTTSTVLGTIVHFCGEEFIKTNSVDKLEIFKYLYNLTHNTEFPFTTLEDAEHYFQTFTHQSYDIQHILSQYKPMGNTLIKYLSSLPKVQFNSAKSEQMVSAEIIPGFYIAGSCDLQVGSNIYDYKTTSSLSAPSSVNYGYRLQLLAYAYALVKSGVKIDTASIIWITTHQVNRFNDKGKPLADYPATCSVSQSIQIDEQSLSFIESILKLVAETVQFVQAHPEYAYIAFRDYRLKLSEQLPIIPFKKDNNVSS